MCHEIMMIVMIIITANIYVRLFYPKPVQAYIHI